MYEGKPLVLVIGASDTGRTPIAAGLLRRALGAGVVVRTAGVVSHEGEGAMPEAQMALDQIGIDISRHISRPLRHEEHRNAELLLAVDRGTELVLFSEFPNDPRVACLAVLADKPDVLDPHRMPLGVWVTAMQQLSDQVTAALPQIRERLGIADQEVLPFLPRNVERRRATVSHDPVVLGTGHKMQWDRDEDMQRLLSLIERGGDQNEANAATSPPESTMEQDNASTNFAATPRVSPERVSTASQQAHGMNLRELRPLEPEADEPESSVMPVSQPALTSTSPAHIDGPAQQRPIPAGDRMSHVGRIIKMLETMEEMPEVIDWNRMRQEIISRLRGIAQQATGPMDFAPAATLMIEGKLMQLQTQPPVEGLYMLRRSVKRLEAAVNPTDLATIGGELGEW